jgi:hypothetical protein
MADLGPFMDKAAELHTEIERLNEEVLILALAGLGLAIALTIVSWKLWHTS